MKTPAKILVVEDDKISAFVLKGLLQRTGYEVVGTVASGEEAIKILEKEKVAAVLTDQTLEGNLSGIETARVVRDKWKTPCIIISAYLPEDLKKHGDLKDSDKFTFITKPYEEDELVDILAKLVG